MTKDLEETLAELGPEYRRVVERLAAGRDTVPEFSVDGARRRSARVFLGARWRRLALAAATVFVAIGLAALFVPSFKSAGSRGESVRAYTAAYSPDASSREWIVASQRADGSWENDFLTRQNAAALAGSDRQEERIAYKKALRYLRSKGLLPITAEELKFRSEAVRRDARRRDFVS